MAKRIAVVVPVKNGGNFIAECFDSLLRQDIPEPFEVCVYDDGSSDITPEIIESYKAKFVAKGHQFLSSRGEVSGGVGYAKNQAVQLSSAPFLCFCDADDVCAENRLRIQLAACLNTECPESCIVGGKFHRYPEGSTRRFTEWACNLDERQLYSQIYTSFGPTLVAPTWFMSRSLYNSVGGFDQSVKVGFPEDLDFFYRALNSGAELFKVEEDIVMYRYHNDCATFSVTEKTLWEIRLRHLEEHVLEKLESFTIWNAGKQGKRFFRSACPSVGLNVLTLF
ncbi:UDP-GlcNAc:betaGal beta-1,3-N-acetylglucosaminyltransferase-like protein 1-like protein [Aphelenchoides avenae]|nr:UDP-GlcNAc:betaGal beta-1,3-N-acetylglucosaminyltransferase-like protein 1-like protein [Aphelenchus avenae]